MNKALLATLLCWPLLLTAADQPNILVLVADDLGYSDLGPFGSEIETPNIDALANAGMLLTNFHSGPSCGPTRAMMLSGTDHHLVGMGWQSPPEIPETQNNPHYTGHLNDNVATLPSLLADAGYHTYMVGKWHMGREPHQRPNARGFERSYVTAGGGASHFGDQHDLFDEEATYWEDDKEITIPEDFYSSTFYTDRMIDFIDAGRKDGKPFFSYVAYTSVHWPVQVPDDWLDRYKGKYDKGWDVLRDERLDRMRAQGIVGKDVTAYPRREGVPAWEELSPIAKQVETRKMEIYAAMVANLDFHIGRMIDYLKKTDQYDNTFILFFSDNGAEGNNIGGMVNNPYWLPARFDNRLENLGRPRSYIWMGPGWSHVSALPNRMYKGFVSEGGIRTPAFVTWPGLDKSVKRSNAVITVMDVLPTALGLAGHAHPGKTYQGREVVQPRGRSWLPHLTGQADNVHGSNFTNGWEVQGRNAFRQGDWKILWLWDPFGPGRWELFNLADDPGETRDLAAAEPKKLAELLAGWKDYVENTGVVVLDRDEGYGRK